MAEREQPADQERETF
ncbi:hypothetical protein PSE305_02620 [Pseudomonas aeruginosa]|nr:hypothetical protein PSE305_02620 [Pseudomonas aeruginosa]